MKIQKQNSYLPLDIAIKYYQKWDCDISCLVDDSIYYKCLNGSGSVDFLNGNSYVGTFKNGFMHGKGIYKWKNGLVYQGEMSKNTISGQGKLRWADGSYYVGSVCEGKRHGIGEYFCSADNSNYKGGWNKGIKQGKGTLTFSNGAIYQGNFQAGLREGQGKMKYQSGNEYSGCWKGDKKQGRGIMNWFSKLEKYEGQWKNDLPSGLGTYYWFQGKGDNKTIKTIYKGQWKMGKRQGFGTFYYNNGCRLEGTFSNNLKQGVCFIIDQFGQCRLQTFKCDKSLLKKEQIGLKEEKKHLKLPEIKKQNILQNNEPAENNYSKFVDFECEHIDQSIYNVLLRQNSQLRQWYKTIINNLNKEIFNGLSIEGLWRLIKDMKLADQNITVAKLNRQFFKGYKSKYQIQFSSKQKLELIKNNSMMVNSQNYSSIEWECFFDSVKKIKMDWEDWNQLKVPNIKIQGISLSKDFNIHSNQHTILFRHFISYILHLTLLQYYNDSSRSFRKTLEDLFSLIKLTMNPVNNFKTEKNYSQNMTNISHNQSKLHISEQYSIINHTLFEALCKTKPQLLNVIDETVTVKQIYCLLVQSSLLKQPAQKILFLQKIERNMNVKGSLLKKDNKASFVSLEKILLKSSYFTHILNYEMIQSEFDEIIYVFLNRKIGNTQSKQEFLKKYKEIIKSIKAIVSKVQQQSFKVNKAPFNYNRVSNKDKQKQQLLRKMQEERQKKVIEQTRLKQIKREQRQRLLMKRQDIDIKEEDLSEDSDQYYD